MTAVPARPNAHFADLARAEWTKFRSVRSTLWSVVVIVVVTVATGVLGSVATTADMDAADRAKVAADPVAVIFGGAGFGLMGICVLGVLAVTAEFSSGTIRAGVLACPSRTPLLAAKVAVFAAASFAVGEAVGFASYLVGSAVLEHRGVHVSLGGPGVFREVAGFGLFLMMLGLFSLGIGALVRHTAGSLTVALGNFVVLETLGSLLPGDVGRHVNGYLPTNAGELILQSDHQPHAVLSAWQGFGVFTLWTAALLLAAAVSFKRRDVT